MRFSPPTYSQFILYVFHPLSHTIAIDFQPMARASEASTKTFWLPSEQLDDEGGNKLLELFIGIFCTRKWFKKKVHTRMYIFEWRLYLLCFSSKGTISGQKLRHVEKMMVKVFCKNYVHR